MRSRLENPRDSYGQWLLPTDVEKTSAPVVERFVGGPVSKRWIFVSDVVAAKTHYGVSEPLECIAVLQVQGGVTGNCHPLICGFAIDPQVIRIVPMASVVDIGCCSVLAFVP